MWAARDAELWQFPSAAAINGLQDRPASLRANIQAWTSGPAADLDEVPLLAGAQGTRCGGALREVRHEGAHGDVRQRQLVVESAAILVRRPPRNLLESRRRPDLLLGLSVVRAEPSLPSALPQCPSALGAGLFEGAPDLAEVVHHLHVGRGGGARRHGSLTNLRRGGNLTSERLPPPNKNHLT